eukprot:jgi/Psemu1/51370/gm1.51370_g
MVMKLRFRANNLCWVDVDIEPSPYPIQIVESPMSSLDQRQSPTIKVRAISTIDPISCQVKWVDEPSLQIKVNPNAPRPVATSFMAAFKDSKAASLCCLSASKIASLYNEEGEEEADRGEEEVDREHVAVAGIAIATTQQRRPKHSNMGNALGNPVAAFAGKKQAEDAAKQAKEGLSYLTSGETEEQKSQSARAKERDQEFEEKKRKREERKKQLESKWAESRK